MFGLGLGLNLLDKAIGGGGGGTSSADTIDALWKSSDNKMEVQSEKKKIADRELIATTEQEICTANLTAICEGALSSVRSTNTIAASMQDNNQATCEGLVSG